MPAVPHRQSHAALSLAAITVLVASGLAAPHAADAAAATKTRTKTRTIARDVTLTHSNFSIRAGSHRLPQSVWTINVRLGAHATLDAASPGNVIGRKRTTTLALARQERAIAGINGDVFYRSDPTAVPRGGLTHRGVIVKSALQGKDAVLYVTKDGRAHVGEPKFGGRVTTNSRHVLNVHSVNSLENARNGGLTVLDSRIESRTMPKCVEATFVPTRTKGTFRVTAVHYVTKFTRLTGSRRAFMSCKGNVQTWMRTVLHTGTTFTGSWGYGVRNIVTLLSGAYRLIHNGRPFRDKSGVYGSAPPHANGYERLPLTFACVQRDGVHVALGGVEGRHPDAAGMTYKQLASYLAGRRCWEAITLAGTVLSTVVAPDSRRRLGVVNRPALGQGKNVNGLFVVSR